jgi:hypothetical protein
MDQAAGRRTTFAAFGNPRDLISVGKSWKGWGLGQWGALYGVVGIWIWFDVGIMEDDYLLLDCRTEVELARISVMQRLTDG